MLRLQSVGRHVCRLPQGAAYSTAPPPTPPPVCRPPPEPPPSPPPCDPTTQSCDGPADDVDDCFFDTEQGKCRSRGGKCTRANRSCDGNKDTCGCVVRRH